MLPLSLFILRQREAENSASLRATPRKYRLKCGKAQKIKIALLLHTDRLK